MNIWFKNISVYKLQEKLTLSSEEMHNLLSERAFIPCGSQDKSRMGWVAPIGPLSEQLVHETDGSLMICARRQDKVLPAGAIKEQLEQKVFELEQAEGRKVRRKEKADIKDDIIFSLLPRALTRSTFLYAYFDRNGGYLVVNSGSSNAVEEIVDLIRKCLPSVDFIKVSTRAIPKDLMTSWLAEGKVPGEFSLGSDCVFKDARDESCVVRYKNQNLNTESVKNLVKREMKACSLRLVWDFGIEFTIDEHFQIRSLKYLDEINDKVDEVDAETVQEQFDINFGIMSLELNQMIPSLLKTFGEEVGELIAREPTAKQMDSAPFDVAEGF